MRARILAVAAAALLAGCASAGERSGDALERGEAAFRSADYTEAAAAYERHLAGPGRHPRDQEVYLRLATIYLVLGAPRPDPARGVATLRRMVREHPDGSLREVADTILALLGRIDRLQAELGSERRARAEIEERLEALKRIDLDREAGEADPPD